MKANIINSVTLEKIPSSQCNVIENLIQLYLHDFSEFATVGSEYGEVGSDGRFAYRGLDSYWREDGRVPYVIRADDRLVGFALVNQWSALARPVDQAVAEFFILRKYQRIGIGRRAATGMFENCRTLGNTCGSVQSIGALLLATHRLDGGGADRRGAFPRWRSMVRNSFVFR